MKLDILYPSGEQYVSWSDRTTYTKSYHVAVGNPKASDKNLGDQAHPFKTIQRAAALLKPGEEVIIHAGVYRETVVPVQGGENEVAMIRYRAAEGEDVVISALEVWRTRFRESEGWSIPPIASDGGDACSGATNPTIWMAELPSSIFAGYNPFALRNIYTENVIYGKKSDQEWMKRLLLRRGTLFYQGEPLRQLFYPQELAEHDGAFWVEEPGVRIHFRLPGDVEPTVGALEISCREQCFAPATMGLGYIHLCGIGCIGAADGFPVPQRGSISTTRGHHWIIEKCRITHCNAVGIDVGNQDWKARGKLVSGGHIIDSNQINLCGICGIAGAGGVDGTLVRGNSITYIGGKNVEEMWECAGIKFHTAEKVIIIENRIENCTHACAIWFDYNNSNCRITWNLFRTIRAINGGVYSEANHSKIWIDKNIFIDIGPPAEQDTEVSIDRGTGAAVMAASNEELMVTSNLFWDIGGYGVYIGHGQARRIVAGRNGTCRGNTVFNNILNGCRKQIHLGVVDDNYCDYNIYDCITRGGGFSIRYPEPGTEQNLAGWIKIFDFDSHSVCGIDEVQVEEESVLATFRHSLLVNRKETPIPRIYTKGYDTEGAVGPFPIENSTLSQESYDSLADDASTPVVMRISLPKKAYKG